MARSSPASRRQVLADLGLLAFVWVAMIVVVRPVGDFPINDDWVYAAAVRSLLTTGRFEVASWSSANVGPLAYWGAAFTWLFGFSFTVLRASTLIVGLAGGMLVYALFRVVWSHRALALVAAAMLLVDPIYFALSCTFMTDVPFFALSAGALLALVVGLRDDDVRLIAVGLAIALATVLMRQFAVVILAGFALAYVAKRGLSVRAVVVGVAPLVAGLLINFAFSRWLVESGRKPYPAGIASLVPSSTTDLVANLKWAALLIVSYLGLLALPLVVAASAWATARSRRRVVLVGFALATAAIAAIFVPRRLLMPIGTNILAWSGIGPLANGDTMALKLNLPEPSALATATWAVVTVAAIVAAAWILVALIDGSLQLLVRVVPRLRRPQDADDVTASLFIGTGASYLAVLLLLSTTTTLFDRYLLPLVLLVGLLLPLRSRVPTPPALGFTRSALVIALLVASATFSVVATHDFLAWSRVRWGALQDLLAQGVAPTRIDGGYEFNGWYLYDAQYVGDRTRNWWWVVGDEYAIASGPLPGYRVVETRPVARWWPDAGRDVFILRR